jgi:hypothetical protein
MELFRRRSAWQRNNIVMRLGCFLVSASMLVSLVIQPPKAKAIVTEASLATSVIWAFMQSAGITFNGTGMNSSSWAESIEPYLREFTEATDSAAKSFWNWLGYDGAADFIKALSWSKITHPSTMPFPSVTIPPAVAKKLARFTVWFAEKVGLVSGGESKPVYSSSGSTYLNLADGSKFYFFSVDYEQFNSSIGWHDCKSSLGLGTIALDLGTGESSEKRADFTLSSGATFSVWVLGGEKSPLQGCFNAGSVSGSFSSSYSTAWMYKNSFDSIGLFVGPDGRIRPICHNIKTGFWGYSTNVFMDKFTLSALNGVSEGASSADAIQPGALSPTYDDTEEKATIITIPGLDTEIAGINELLQAILDKLAANELTTSATIAQQPTPEQPDEEKPDLNGLGLPALGAALVTRFPFSIPWDVVKGIKLVAAPAEAPRWEVDFLAPIAGRVGGWKGSTKVVIDMGEYPIIGQVCRWTSMIGFCLILASGTKKLIWTA